MNVHCTGTAQVFNSKVVPGLSETLALVSMLGYVFVVDPASRNTLNFIIRNLNLFFQHFYQIELLNNGNKCEEILHKLSLTHNELLITFLLIFF